MVQYSAINGNADLEFLSTPHCKVCNSSYEFAVLSKNKILRDFWETQRLKNGLNRQFWKKIAWLWLRHLRFESLLRAKRVTSFCQVFKVEICKANTTVTWQVDIICHKAGSFTFSLFLCPNTAFYGGVRAFFLCFKILWELLRDSKRQQNSKVILVRFRAFMTETFERHRSNQNRNTNWYEQKIWETFQKI